MKILPDKNGIYNGAYVRDIGFNKANVKEYEKATGQKLDISGKFMDFRWGLEFPVEMAEIMSQNGGALLIRLETGEAYPLDDILSGKADHLLKQFAQGARAFGKPVFVSIDHEMNGNWYNWGGNPDKYVSAYRYIHDKIESFGANNITWVWNPAMGPSDKYYPGDAYVDWVALNGYCKKEWNNWASFKNTFSFWLGEIDKYKKPIMIAEFGCDETTAEETSIKKPRWLSDAIETISHDSRIKAFMYFNISKEEYSEGKHWTSHWPLTGRSMDAYREAMKKHDALFRNGIFTGDRIVPGPRTNMAAPVKKPATASSNPNAAYITDASGTLFNWNGGNAIYNDGIWKFVAEDAKDAGFHIDLTPVKVSGSKKLKFSISGNGPQGGYPRLEMQVFDGDKKIALIINGISSSGKEFSVDLPDLKNATKLLFIMAGKSSCDVRIKNLRIE